MSWSKMLLPVLALALLASLAGTAQAQRMSFSIGGGGGGHYGHHGHHHHHHHPSWSFGFYSPPPPRVTYVYPAPVVREQVYVYPQQTVLQQPVTVAPAPAPTSNWTSRPEPKANALPASQAKNSWVIIRNPAASGGPVAFLIDEETDVRLEEGQSRSLSGGPRTVEFDRGGDFGAAKKTLSEGTYEFVVTDRGWDLVNKKEVERTATKPGAVKNALPR